MKTTKLALLLIILIASLAHAEIKMTLLYGLSKTNGARAGSGEILAYSTHEHTVLSTLSGSDIFGVQVLELHTDGSVKERGTINFNTVFGSLADIHGASSTAIDPQGRGFGAVSLIPIQNGKIPGKVGFFDYRKNHLSAIIALDVGFHPDQVKFSQDGSSLYVVNEGEFTVGGNQDAPGSISIIDLSGITKAADLISLNNNHVKTYDFQAANLAKALKLNIRINDLTTTLPYRHIEPEYLDVIDNQLYVSLQENNAIAVFDLQLKKWVKIYSLETITQTIDASDKDGGAFIDDQVTGLPMPDNLVIYQQKGKKYLITANEGDARADKGDRVRVKDIAHHKIDPAVKAKLNTIYGNFAAKKSLGRLSISAIDGDIDRDGKIEQLTMFGTRSFSVWDAESGKLIADSGSLETILLSLDPTKHNINNLICDFDKRSPKKGPEPEALALGNLNGKAIVFIGLERQNGILAYDISNPKSLKFKGYINSMEKGLLAPESIIFIQAKDNPTGQPLLLVGFEGNNGGIGIYSVQENTAQPLLNCPNNPSKTCD